MFINVFFWLGSLGQKPELECTCSNNSAELIMLKQLTSSISVTAGRGEPVTIEQSINEDINRFNTIIFAKGR